MGLDEGRIEDLIDETHSIVDMERLQPLLSQKYQSVFRAYMRLRLFASARKFLAMAEETWILYGGDRHPNVKGVSDLWEELRESEGRSIGPHRY